MAFRQKWIERGSALVRLLQLPFEIDLANDPFFGRGGKIVADSQREQALKFELLVPVATPSKPTACLSFNYHMEHFGEIWNIQQPTAAVRTRRASASAWSAPRSRCSAITAST